MDDIITQELQIKETATSAAPIHYFRRVEKKYLLERFTVERIKSQIGFYIPVDEQAAERPFIRSVYYDNRDWKCYTDHRGKIKPRFKVRFRKYEKPGQASEWGFVELKSSDGSVTSKERFKVRQPLLDWTATQEVPEAIALLNADLRDEELHEIYRKIFNAVHRFELAPVLRVCYQREAFQSRYDALRVTFDSQLECDPVLNTFGHPFQDSQQMVGDLVVMEIKYSGKIPSWLVSLLKANRVKRRRFSKYCTAVETLYALDTQHPCVKSGLSASARG